MLSKNLFYFSYYNHYNNYMNGAIINVKNISKSFGETKAVNDISFVVPHGSFFAFLGQNGAGKSTTINMLTGLLQKDSGEIFYTGNKSVTEFKNEIGVVFQSNVFDDYLSVKENLQLYGTFYLHNKAAVNKRCEEIISLFNLQDIAKKRFKKLSGGQKRKAEIAKALFSFPKILFLDEPTAGLDPKTRMDVWNVLHKVQKDSGMTLFLTTHYMEETAEADKVVIIHKGKKVCEGSPSELKAKYSHDKIFIVPKDNAGFEKKLLKLKIPLKKIADNYVIRADDTVQSIDTLNTLKEDIRFYEVKKGSMDDVFLTVVGESIGEVQPE